MARLVCVLLLLAGCAVFAVHAFETVAEANNDVHKLASAYASESRIIGGRPTTIDRYPWIVQMQRSLTGVWRQFGGGSVLTSRVILTSASCFKGPSFMQRLRRVMAGSSTRNTGGQIGNILRVAIHPSWNEGLNYDGDIAVVHLETPLQFTTVVQPATIIGQGAFIPDNMPAVQVGWGATFGLDFPQIFSPVSLELDVITVNNGLCAQTYAGLPGSPAVTSNMICAGALVNAGACVGDRGGPLLINNIVVGIVSWGWRCTNATFPTVHTAVPAFTNWIVQNAAS